MGKIRVKTLGNEELEKAQHEEAKKRREVKKEKKEKAHIKGLGLKGGQQIKVVEGVELKPEVEALLHEQPEKIVGGKTPKKAVQRVRSKRYRELTALVDKSKPYTLKEALELVKKTATTKFDGTVEAHINLNPELFTKEKASLSGVVNLPHGTGKKRVIAIADDAVLAKIEKGQIDFHALVANPAMMSKLAKYARILGPRGLMPNPKNGTVTPDPQKRAKELEGGEINWKTEPTNPIVHLPVGKASFSEKQLEENIEALVTSVGQNNILKLILSSTMGPGIKVNISSL